MEKSIITFSANEQNLQKTGGIGCYASDTVSYIEAHFDLGDNWSGYDSIRAVWFNDYKTISTVLDSDGVCIVPHEVLTSRGKVMVNLVGSVLVSDELSDRLTTFPCEAVKVTAKAKIEGSETQPITPSQFEQFVSVVISEVEKVTGMTAQAETLPAGSQATARYENGILYLGIPQGIQGERGETGADGNGIASVVYNADYTLTLVFDNGERFTTPPIRGERGPAGADGRDGTDGRDGADGVTPNLSIGTVETLEPTQDAYVTRRGTDDNPIFDFGIPKGEKGETGETGNGIASVAKTNTSGLVDTYTITYTDGTTSTFNVTNGEDGEVTQAEFDGAVTDLKSDVAKRSAFEIRDIYTLTNSRDGYYIGWVEGAEYPAGSQAGHTDYIDLSDYYGSLTMSLLAPSSGYVTYQGAFYDENKNYVKGYVRYQLTQDEDFVVPIPQNARYLRFTYLIEKKNAYYIKATTKNSINYQFYKDWNNDIFTVEGATEGIYVRESDGVVVSNSSTGATDYINVAYIKSLLMNNPVGSMHQGAFYDKNKVFVTGYHHSASVQNAEFEVNIPPNAVYIRISYLLANVNDYYAISTALVRDAFAKEIINNLPDSSITRFSSMKMNCLGDSITYGYIPDSGAQMVNPYPSIVKELLGLAECRNYGISGSTLAVNSGNYQPMCVRYAEMSDDADIVLVFGGTNDYGRAVYSTLGTISDSVNSTIYGALNILCEGLITKYPKALIFLCTPLKRADKTGANGGGYTLEDVADAIRKVGLKFGMPVLDLDAKGGFYISNSAFRAQYGGNDKLHPNQAFDNEHLAPMIARFIDSTI